MNRFHVSVGVANIERSVAFYTTLFGTGPAVLKDDYAKWMLDDPRLNFSISENSKSRKGGINHVGLQTDTTAELQDIQARLDNAGQDTFEQPDAECCYARSTKTWVRDPDGVAWESFVTHENITHYGNDLEPDASDQGGKCCKVKTAEPCCV